MTASWDSALSHSCPFHSNDTSHLGAQLMLVVPAIKLMKHRLCCASFQTHGALPGGLLTQALQPRARATTHTDLQLRARALGIEVRVVHNASIISAVGACGLQLYRYGEASAHLSSADKCKVDLVSAVQALLSSCDFTPVSGKLGSREKPAK